jgi:hypothetical protein
MKFFILHANPTAAWANYRVGTKKQRKSKGNNADIGQIYTDNIFYGTVDAWQT